MLIFFASRRLLLEGIFSFCMEMKTVTAEILHELIEKIEVHQIVGTGKSRVQQIVIHYRFVGCIEIPD